MDKSEQFTDGLILTKSLVAKKYRFLLQNLFNIKICRYIVSYCKVCVCVRVRVHVSILLTINRAREIYHRETCPIYETSRSANKSYRVYLPTFPILSNFGSDFSYVFW